MNRNGHAYELVALTFLVGLIVVADPAILNCARVAAAGPRGAVHALFDLTSTTTSPFPSDAFSVPDETQLTGMRVNLPVPLNCAGRESDCEDIADVNTLDGFNVLPRITIPFDGDIDPASATSANILIVPMDDAGAEHIIGINQVTWDAPSQTLAVTSDELLDQHTRYALIVKNGLRDREGRPVEASDSFTRFRHDLNFGRTHDSGLKAYRKALLDALAAARTAGEQEDEIVSASVFTTQSVTSTLERIETQIHAWAPAPATFDLGSAAERTVFPFAAVRSWTIQRQTGVAPTFASVNVSLVSSNVVPNAIGQLGFGRFQAPEYRTSDLIMPRINTAEDPAPQSANTLYFDLWVPSTPRPTNGWPIVLCGHGSARDKEACIDQASVLNAHGLAVISINLAGHGFGAAGTMTIARTDGSVVTLPAGGRGIDTNGDGTIAVQEGDEAPRQHRLALNRDAMIQDVVEFMTLARLVETGGLDIDGDGISDFDADHITYTGQSLGSMYGTVFTAIEPHVQASTLSAPGAPPIENRVYSPLFRPAFGTLLAQHAPSLINTPGITSLEGVVFAGPYFNENRPLRNVPPVTNEITGALAIQRYIDAAEWMAHNVDPAAWARHLRLSLLPGQPVKHFLYLAHRTDQVSAGPNFSWIVRSGDCQDRVSYYRHDLYWLDHPLAPKNPHGAILAIANVNFREIAAAMQEQEAIFLASDGAITIHPAPSQYFEVPMVSALPEDLDYIQ